MWRAIAVMVGSVLSLGPGTASAAAAWGSAGYGDPPGWCTRFSDMWTATVVTSDPLVDTNPERETFYGFHPNPGYDDWYGYFYGDFRGTPGDASGWVQLLHERYPDHYHWNFATNGWAVHGHAKQYIAYYNWTFGGQCGAGGYGEAAPPPFMADQYGWPVVDIYVDSVAPYPPAPRVASESPASVTFTWDPVADQGDGAGPDFFEAGMDHYTSWVTVDGLPAVLQLESTPSPRTIVQPLTPLQTACVHVQAFDRLQNGTPVQVACGQALAAPPMPSWLLASRVAVNPSPGGLVGFDSWLWLDPAPGAVSLPETYEGVRYVVTAVPVEAVWWFGDGADASYPGASGFGIPYPLPSAVHHQYQAESSAGYRVQAAVDYSVSWTAVMGGAMVGPYPMGQVTRSAVPLGYPVEQAQPELLHLGP